ncbi:DUF2213 domain-containing protein [Saccharibacter floricola]|uniref:DUF2213 domain-containing protein n=1 Tax=Saccharibacter floricola DSM 15669 TaxID=1123227 RepID=A0ABQ0P455_9PROT|nr:DUF2213 domain-containing protein [Saccharibacter floricola]GBQ08442.1 hypothetical protein AA15669_1785 [Saccharibacter floricola DSM 15669]
MLSNIADAAPSSRWKDAINALHAGKSVITKAGVDEYLGKDLSVPGLDPHKIYRIYRPPDVIKAALPAMRSLRILDGHHFETADNLAQDKLVGATGDQPEMQGDAALINVTIWNGPAIRDIESKKKEQLSLGYGSKITMPPGTTPDGRPYDGKMTKIIPEHVALVTVGRVNHEGNSGPLAKIADTGDMMDFQAAIQVLCQTCPDTPADEVRAKITEALAELNTKEAKNGPNPTSKENTTKDEAPTSSTSSPNAVNEKTLNSLERLSHVLTQIFTKKDTAMADEDAKKNHAEEERIARDVLRRMGDKDPTNVRECLEHMGLTDAAKRAMTQDEAHGKTGDAPGYKHTQNDLFGGTSTNTISGGGHGRGGWHHDEDTSQEQERKEDDKEKRMKAARLEAKDLLDKGMHPEAVALHLEKSRNLPKENAQEIVKRARSIPASEGKPSKDTSKTKDEDEQKRKEEIRREVEEQRKAEREEDEKKRKQADEARDDVEKETGRLHGCKTGDSAADLYRVGLANLGYQGADILPEEALQSTFRSFAAQRQQGSAHLGDSAENAQNTANVQTLARELLG